MKQDHGVRQRLRDYLTMTLGITLAAIGVYFFKFPNHFSTGGVTGIAVVTSQLLPGLSATALSNLLNILLLIFGLVMMGRDFGIKTVYCTLLLTLLLAGFAHYFPMTAPFTDQPLLELIFAMLLSATGGALLFHVGASSGGTEIIAMVFRKYMYVYNISTALFGVDFLVTLTTFWVFDIRTGLFSLLGLVLRGTVIQAVLHGLQQRKYFHIITEDAQAIRHYILHHLNRSATIFEGHGAYTDNERTLIMVVVDAKQAMLLKDFVKKTSPNSFLFISNTHDIIGKGFRNVL